VTHRMVAARNRSHDGAERLQVQVLSRCPPSTSPLPYPQLSQPGRLQNVTPQHSARQSDAENPAIRQTQLGIAPVRDEALTTVASRRDAARAVRRAQRNAETDRLQNQFALGVDVLGFTGPRRIVLAP